MWVIAIRTPFDDIFVIGSIICVILFIVFLIGAGTKSFRKQHKLDDRAKTTGKRFVRWLDKKFPADDSEDGKN